LRGAVIAFVITFIGLSLVIRSWEGVLLALVCGVLAGLETHREEGWYARKRRSRK